MKELSVWVRTGAQPGTEREAARDLLLAAASGACGVPVAALGVGYEPGGRPLLTGVSGLHVSVSHGRGLVAVAVSAAGPVGVDAEAQRSLPVAGLARRWLLPAEAAWVHGHEEAGQALAFLKLWTAKEAMGKALGLGMREGGRYRPVPLPPSPELVPGPDGLHVAGLVTGGAVLAVASTAPAVLRLR
ncbi:4'-phosphopantetheinyl transferase family protein [Longispora albida]|uniref:4'-phosphopantetheinyl transferase family protein n=1 Tax=Longispora albida TaxID=203523 RepID=UPI00036575A2|nr:4'-phosphopantetheinyl transferase superfamily protein [Longispora albida]